MYRSRASSSVAAAALDGATYVPLVDAQIMVSKRCPGWCWCTKGCRNTPSAVCTRGCFGDACLRPTFPWGAHRRVEKAACMVDFDANTVTMCINNAYKSKTKKMLQTYAQPQMTTHHELSPTAASNCTILCSRSASGGRRTPSVVARRQVARRASATLCI